MSNGESETRYGIDAGRHQLLVARSEGSQPSLVRHGDDRLSVTLRWLDDGPRRFSDRVLSLAGEGDRAADTAADIVDALPDGLDGQFAVAVPVAFGPQCRADVVRGLRRSGLDVDGSCLIDRPVAAAANWWAERQSAATITGPVLLIDNDAGELSAIALDPLTRRLLTMVPLTASVDDHRDDVAARLQAMANTVARLTHPADELLRDTSHDAAATRLGQIVLTGIGADQPELIDLVRGLFPTTTLASDNTPAAHRVACGLTQLDVFESWIACWPTLDLTCDGETLVACGPQAISEPDDDLHHRGADQLELVAANGCVLEVSAGTCHSGGITIPSSLRDELQIKVLDDGRVLLLGPLGTPPLALLFGWPCPGTTATAVPIRSVGRRAVTLAPPRRVLSPVGAATA